MNYFQVNNRIPLDSYNTQSIEISRGPNSMLFGLGTPAGIVNQTATQADLKTNSAEIGFRTDQYGSLRETFSFNKVLIAKKLAVYGAALYNKQQFDRKPSYDTTKRLYGAFTYKPFKRTTIRGFVETYDNDANRPNALTPRDFVSDWFAQGRPAYDPVTRMITKLDTNQTYGPYVFSSASPGYDASVTTLLGVNRLTTIGSPMFLQGIQFENQNRVLYRIDGNEEVDVFQRQALFYRPAHTNPATASPLPTGASLGWTTGDARYAIMDRSWTASNGRLLPTVASTTQTYYQTYNYAGVSDKSIYDWTKYNVLAANFSKQKAKHYFAEIDQEIIRDLYFNAAFLRQDIDAVQNNTISQLAGATLYVDTNLKLPDGSVNPYFGLPFIGEGNGPDTFFTPQVDDHMRASLAYTLDLTRNQNRWLKILGSHRFIVNWSKTDTHAEVERWRNAFNGGEPDALLRFGQNLTIPTNNIWNVGNGGLSRYYYMASPGDEQGRVSHSTGRYGNLGWDTPHTTSVRVYDYINNHYRSVVLTNGTMFADNGSYSRERKLESWVFGTQNNLWGDRILTTFGWREDELLNRRTQMGSYVDADGVTVPAIPTADLLTNGVVKRDVVMNTRWTPWSKMTDSTNSAGVVFRPFKNWGWTSGDSFLADFIGNLGFTYNKSNTWNPPSQVQTDFFKNELAKPTGEGEDIGFSFSAFKGKLVGRVSWFETSSQAERAGTAGTLITRLAYGDTTLMYNWAAAVVRIREYMKTDPTLANIAADANKTWNSDSFFNLTNDANRAKVYELMDLPFDYYSGTNIAGTQTNRAKGVEAQLTYNPTNNWTVKLTASKQETMYDDVAPEYDAWLAARMPVWTSAVAADIPDFVDGNNVTYSLKNFWKGVGYHSAVRINNADGNTNTENYFNNVVVSQEATARALEGSVAPQQSKYRGSIVTNYRFNGGALRGWAVGGSQRYASKAIIGYYGYAADPTKPTMINSIDTNRPIYADAEWYTDLWVSYSRKIMKDKVNMKIQLNVSNVFEPGGLKPIAVNFDGTPWSYRIIDPRLIQLTTKFSF